MEEVVYKVCLVKGEFTYEQMIEYFDIKKDSEKVECIKNWGLYAAGTIYRIDKTDYGFYIH